MRTKTLILAAALTAAGIASSLAQSNVYSLNVVGYVNIPVPANTKLLIANQLNTTNNTIGSLLQNPVIPAGAQLFKFNAGYTPYTMDEFDLTWSPNASATLNPGEGAFFISPSATTITFVGEVLQGSLTNTLPAGIKVVRSSIVPQAGTLPALGVPGEAGDQAFLWSGGFTPYTFDEFDLSWTPSVPSVGVGQSFFYTKAAAGTQTQWIRNFTVN